MNGPENAYWIRSSTSSVPSFATCTWTSACDERERLRGRRAGERERGERSAEERERSTRPACEKLTAGTSRSPGSSISKNSRGWKPNMPASSTAGKVWIALW